MQVKELNDRLIVFFHHTILIDNYCINIFIIIYLYMIMN